MKPNRAVRILASLALALGLAHLAFGVVVYKTFNLEVFWFLGFGLAMIVTALANFRQDNIWVLRMQNALTLGFIIALLTLASEPQVWIGAVLFGGLFCLSCRNPVTPKNKGE